MRHKKETLIHLILVHNRYRFPGGEERAVDEYQQLFRSLGHDVSVVFAQSSELSHLRAGRALLTGGEQSFQETLLAKIHEKSGQVVVHAHNLHPLVGVRSLQAARAAGARVILHLHNYRLYCAIGTAFREGRICDECRTTTLPSLRHRCRGSLAEAAVYAAAIQRQRPGIFAAVDHFVVPSHTALEQLKTFGFSAESHTSVIPNPLLSFPIQKQSHAQQGKFMLYVGRLSPEKGIDRVIEVAVRNDIPLVIAGTGDQENTLRKLAKERSKQFQRAHSLIHFAGWVDRKALQELYQEAAFLVMPSRCAEVYPYAVLEAMANGLPVLASNTGSMTTLLPEELIVQKGDWQVKSQALWDDVSRRRSLGQAMLANAEAFSPQRIIKSMQTIWDTF